MPIQNGSKFIRMERLNWIREDVADLELAVVTFLKIRNVGQRVLVNFGAAGDQDALQLVDNGKIKILKSTKMDA